MGYHYNDYLFMVQVGLLLLLLLNASASVVVGSSTSTHEEQKQQQEQERRDLEGATLAEKWNITTPTINILDNESLTLLGCASIISISALQRCVVVIELINLNSTLFQCPFPFILKATLKYKLFNWKTA